MINKDYLINLEKRREKKDIKVKKLQMNELFDEVLDVKK